MIESPAVYLLESLWCPRQEVGTRLLPHPTSCRYLPSKQDTFRPRTSLSVCKLCLPTYRPVSSEDDTVILVHRATDHFAVLVQGLKDLEATAKHVKFAGRPVKILAVYISSSRPLIISGLSACLGGGLPILVAGDLIAKHVDWNFCANHEKGQIAAWLRQQKLLFDLWAGYTNHHSVQPICHPDVLDIVLTKEIVTPACLTARYGLSWDDLRLLILTRCLSSLSLPDHPDFRRTDWTKFQTRLENGIPSSPELPDEMTIDTWVDKLSSVILEVLPLPAPSCRPCADLRFTMQTRIQGEIRLKNRSRRQWKVISKPSVKAEASRLQKSVVHQLYEWKDDHWSDTLKALDPEDRLLWRMTKLAMWVTTLSLLLVTRRGIAVSDSRNLKPLLKVWTLSFSR